MCKFAAETRYKRQMPARFYQMDIVRYILAVSVIIAHFNIVFDSDFYWPISSGTAVGVFFGFSGFLVYASYLRHNNFRSYFFSRARRILPAYWLVVVTSAIMLCGVSSLNPVAYFSDSSFLKYLVANLSFLNFLQPDLPGVFTDHNVTAVNGSLWTLKVEWMLYLSLPLIIWICRKYKIRMLTACLCLFVFSLAYNNLMEIISIRTGSELFFRLSYQFAGQFVYFYMGVLCYTYRQHILSRRFSFFCLGVILLGLYYGIESILNEGFAKNINTDLLFPIASTIFFLSISLPMVISPRFTNIIGNCSYEMYLFHFPILQSLNCSSAFCSLPKWMMLCISLILVYAVSYMVHELLGHHNRTPDHG